MTKLQQIYQRNSVYTFIWFFNSAISLSSGGTGTLQNSPSSAVSSLNQPSAGSFMISEIPKDIDPMKSLREVLSQSHTSIRSRRSLSSGFRSLQKYNMSDEIHSIINNKHSSSFIFQEIKKIIKFGKSPITCAGKFGKLISAIIVYMWFLLSFGVW